MFLHTSLLLPPELQFLLHKFQLLTPSFLNQLHILHRFAIFMIMLCFPIVVVEFNGELMPVGYDIGVVGLMV